MSGERDSQELPSPSSIRHSTFGIRHSGGSTHTSTKLSMSGGLPPLKTPPFFTPPFDIRHSAFDKSGGLDSQASALAPIS